jgi:hypothetical protein
MPPRPLRAAPPPPKPMIPLRPSSLPLRIMALEQLRERSAKGDALTVRIHLCDGPERIHGRDRRVLRHETFIFSGGECVGYSFFCSELWETMTPQEKRLVESDRRWEDRT